MLTAVRGPWGHAVALLGALWLAGAPLTVERRTVRGEVVDVQCQRKAAENTGPSHVDCALSCAKRGALMGVLTADGLYIVTGDYTASSNQKLIPFVARVVDATGVVTVNGETKTIRVEGMKVFEDGH
jgi:hypothetical protein